MHLADCIRHRDNNLNLLRILAALAVLMGHSFALLAQPEPWGARWGVTPGSVAVDMFFIVSGMLVCGSLASKQNVADYICARVLRIFPGLVVMLLMTLFVLGPYFTRLPLATYFSVPETLNYFIRCASLIAGVAYYLPGVFELNPFPGAVNGSLWTMPYEIKMYILLLIFWAVGSLFKKWRLATFKYLLLAFTFIAGWLVFVHHFQSGETRQFERLFFMFFSGASMSLWREKIALKPVVFYLLLPAVIASVAINKELFFIFYTLSIAYLVVCIAYIPSGIIRKFNACGDYSYGVYIYAFPVQQATVALFPHILVWQLILMSSFVTLVLAVFSWHCIEKPTLDRKAETLNYVQTLFAGRQKQG